MRGKGKGPEFERDICHQLSMWWSEGQRDDIFWRTANSGGRAIQRKGKSTFGQYGDVQATDPLGQALIDLCTIELKRGYNNASLSDLLDKPTNTQSLYKRFIAQAIENSQKAKTFFWMLIVKRDRRLPLVILPYGLWKAIKGNQTKILFCPGAIIRFGKKPQNHCFIFVVSLDQFFKNVSYKNIIQILRITKAKHG